MSNPLPSSAQAAHFLKTAERQRTQDWLFHRLTQAFSLLVLLALAGIIVSLFMNAWPTFAKFGARLFGMLSGTSSTKSLAPPLPLLARSRVPDLQC